MESLRLICFLSLCLMPLAVTSQQEHTDLIEVAALRTIAKSWNIRIWNDSIDPCMKGSPWLDKDANPGIACRCSANTCHITKLKVYALDAVGQIPIELFNLTELRDLNLDQNVLSGPIPAEIGKLSKMEYLSLGINNLSSSVPPELGNLTLLKSLSFSANKVSGPIPRELGNLTSLEQLYIDSSGVMGDIPQELGKLKNLQILWASDNLFTGQLPEFFGTLLNLKDLRIQGTRLEGPIPRSFSALTKLQNLRIGDLTMVDSTLHFVENLTQLSILSLRNCRVTGTLPKQLGNFPDLIYLDLSFNKLTGPIPSSFQNFKSLQFLYLGSNNLSGDLPSNILTPSLTTLDVSFNQITGSLPVNYDKQRLSINLIGTSMDASYLKDSRATEEILSCLQTDSSCRSQDVALVDSSFSVNCGGAEQISASGIVFSDDSEVLEAASFYVDSQHQWLVSNTGLYISNPSGPKYIAETDSQILGTLDSELYKTARISPSSLRYYALGMKEGKYTVELHFAEIVLDDNSESWKGLGKRMFDVYIQGKRVLQDFNIQEEARGSKRAMIKSFEANVTDGIIDIHFFWAGRGTCCIPLQGTYGPLVSAIHVSQGNYAPNYDSSNGHKQTGTLIGVVVGCSAGLLILASVLYLWWKKDKMNHTWAQVDSPRKV
uniref:non-specific serine/threonine protein kinase n=1 Tax=Anthurium amnicola TaxID=1678845 RepID=A0A1D1YL36_9ARAE